MGLRTTSIHVEWLQISDVHQKQKMVFKLLACFNTQFKVKESFKLLLSIKDKSGHILVMKTALTFRGPHSRIWPAKLTNHSARSN